MTIPSGGTLLIDALLDRLGKTQAQALLDRLDQWLSQDDHEPDPQTAGRRRAGNRTNHFEKTSQTSKEPTP